MRTDPAPSAEPAGAPAAVLPAISANSAQPVQSAPAIAVAAVAVTPTAPPAAPPKPPKAPVTLPAARDAVQAAVPPASAAMRSAETAALSSTPHSQTQAVSSTSTPTALPPRTDVATPASKETAPALSTAKQPLPLPRRRVTMDDTARPGGSAPGVPSQGSKASVTEVVKAAPVPDRAGAAIGAEAVTVQAPTPPATTPSSITPHGSPRAANRVLPGAVAPSMMQALNKQLQQTLTTQERDPVRLP